jgi:hypothetical protein
MAVEVPGRESLNIQFTVNEFIQTVIIWKSMTQEEVNYIFANCNSILTM